MSTILAVYVVDPKFPASDQQAGAERYLVSGVLVDALGGQPTVQEVQDHLTPPVAVRAALAVDAKDRLDFEVNFDQENAIRAMRAAVNTLAPGTFPNGQSTQITRVQYRDALIARWNQLNS